MQTLAEAAGVSQATVSMALRNHPRISEGRRRAIQKLARRLGYRMHPMLSTLMRLRRMRRALPIDGLAYLDGYPSEHYLEVQPNTRRIWRGICARATDLGLAVERFSINDPVMAGGRLDRILKARGIRGVILGARPTGEAEKELKLDWDHFAAVTIAHYFVRPTLPRVMSDAWGMVELAMNRLQALGYRRIALVVPEANNRNAGGRWSGAYRDILARRGFPGHRPLLHLHEAGDERGVVRWMRRNRPDGVIVFESGVRRWLRADGWDIPGDVGVVRLGVTEDVPDEAGVDQNAVEVGRTAVDTVAQRLHLHDYGLHQIVRHILVEVVWRPGKTIRKRGPKHRG